MRLLDVLKNSGSRFRENDELCRLHDRLHSLSERGKNLREELIRQVTAGVLPADSDGRLAGLVRDLVSETLAFEGLLTETPKNPPGQLSTADTWESLKILRRKLAVIEDPQPLGRIREILVEIVGAILPEHLPPQGEEHAPALSAPLISLLPHPAGRIEAAI